MLRELERRGARYRLGAPLDVELTTNPDRVLALAEAFGAFSIRPAVQAARAGDGRRRVVILLAEEADDLQQRDAARLAAYERTASAPSRTCRRSRRKGSPPPAGGARDTIGAHDTTLQPGACALR